MFFGYFETGLSLPGGILFWIEIALMVAISVRFARGASKLRSFLNLVKTEDARIQEDKLPAGLE
jgi:hypothetical protein